jgi:phenylpropionate dioxygenase-like ring-hydroxylating dioxygenase large terminal subunit
MFVRNCWYVAGWSRDLISGKLLAMTIINEPLVLYRAADGSPVALHDRCCHKLAKLSLGRLEGDCVRCMYHGLKFDRFGQCIEIPGQEKIPTGALVRRFPIVESGCWLWVWMGDPAIADPKLIPKTPSFDDPKWDLRHGQVDYAADYQLINDNLTDFSHLSIVHTNSFGASSSFAAVRPMVESIERGVRISRWMTGGSSENRNVAGAVGRSADVPVTYMSYDYLVPGILVMRSESFRIEDYPADGRSAPTGVPVTATTNAQAVTPMTTDTSRYFFTTGPRAGPGSGAKAEKLLEIMRIAFDEDRHMIESQALNQKLSPGPEIATTADRAAVMFRAMIRKMIRAESNASSGELDEQSVSA